MYCSQCGNQIHDKAVICIHCGCATPNHATQTFNRAASAVADPNVSPKSGIATVILSVMLGVFGAHRLYAGKVASGIGMMFLFFGGYIALFAGVALMEAVSDGYETTVAGIIGINLTGIMITAWLIWWIVDLVRICTSKFKDSKGLIIKL